MTDLLKCICGSCEFKPRGKTSKFATSNLEFSKAPWCPNPARNRSFQLLSWQTNPECVTTQMDVGVWNTKVDHGTPWEKSIAVTFRVDPSLERPYCRRQFSSNVHMDKVSSTRAGFHLDKFYLLVWMEKYAKFSLLKSHHGSFSTRRLIKEELAIFSHPHEHIKLVKVKTCRWQVGSNARCYFKFPTRSEKLYGWMWDGLYLFKLIATSEPTEAVVAIVWRG